MLRFVAARLVLIPIIILGVITILFLIFKLVPGDEAALAAGATATQAEIDSMRRQLGLDQPLLVQYLGHLVGLVHGNFGYSTMFRGNPLPHVLERVPATLLLTTSAIALTILIGVPAGISAAATQNRWPDLTISASVVALLSVPNFWLGMVLIAVFSVGLHMLPSFGFSNAASLVMPTVALAARLIAIIGRLTRGLVIEEMRKHYVRTARAKGLGFRGILWQHVLPNTLVPIVTAIGIEAGYLLGGSVVVERLFAWPGIGDLLLAGIGVRDYTLVLAISLLFAIGFLLLNLVVDVICTAANPRLRNA
jgi:ABC-type dipeptide/oligopeptide/nickel transport system permease component